METESVSSLWLPSHSFFPPQALTFSTFMPNYPPGIVQCSFFRKPARCKLGTRMPVWRALRPRGSSRLGSPWMFWMLPLHDLENVRCAHSVLYKKNVPSSRMLIIATPKAPSLLLSLPLPPSLSLSLSTPPHAPATNVQSQGSKRQRNNKEIQQKCLRTQIKHTLSLCSLFYP